MELKVENLSYKYEDGDKEALKNLSFTINDGEWVSIIGHNGSGKSTLAKLLIGINSATSGSVYVNGVLVNEDNLYEIRKHIGIVFQNPDNQFVATSLEDDIAFGLENNLVEPKLMKDIIDRSLELVHMNEYKERMPSELSGGQKQRAAIASILAISPDLIIFDEATSYLDPKGRKDFINVLKESKEKGKTILMITHDMNEVMLSDRAIVIADGEIIKDDKTLNVLNDYDTLKKARLEMPSSLYLYHELKRNNYKNKEVLNQIWELASRK